MPAYLVTMDDDSADVDQTARQSRKNQKAVSVKLCTLDNTVVKSPVTLSRRLLVTTCDRNIYQPLATSCNHRRPWPQKKFCSHTDFGRRLVVQLVTDLKAAKSWGGRWQVAMVGDQSAISRRSVSDRSPNGDDHRMMVAS